MFTKCYETFTRTYVWWETIPDGSKKDLSGLIDILLAQNQACNDERQDSRVDI